MDLRPQLPDYCSIAPSSGLSAPSNGWELKQHNTSLCCCKMEKLEEEETSRGKLMDNLSAVKEECVVVLWCVRNVFSLHCTCSRGSVSVCHTALTDYSLSLKMRYLLAGAVVLHCASASYFSSILAMFSNFETWKMAMMRSNNLAMTNCLENKYINIYIYGKIYICFEGNVSKNEMEFLF